MRLLPGQHLRQGDTFFFGLMRQHRARNHIAKRIDARHIGGVMAINLDAPTLIQGNANLIQPKPGHIRPAPNRDQHDIGGEFFCRPTGRGFQLQRDTLF